MGLILLWEEVKKAGLKTILKLQREELKEAESGLKLLKEELKGAEIATGRGWRGGRWDMKL